MCQFVVLANMDKIWSWFKTRSGDQGAIHKQRLLDQHLIVLPTFQLKETLDHNCKQMSREIKKLTGASTNS